MTVNKTYPYPDKLEVKDEVKDEVKEGVSSTTSTDSVPKDYVVVVNTENGK